MLRIDKQRIGFDGVDLQTCRLCFCERRKIVRTGVRQLTVLIPDQIALAPDRAVKLRTPHEAVVCDLRAGGIENVVDKEDGNMVFQTADRQHRILGIRKDVVADHVVGAVMLMIAVGGGTVAEVVFQKNAGRAFVGVQRPSAVFLALDIMNAVAGNDRAAL